MLEIKGITKEYVLKDQKVDALKGVDLVFRRSEFVSILGPSGCGKTTLLNIIGGLDRYTSGDLIVDGVSTKDFKDKDWDNYRNHRVGFVFQSYNLIPHQTVLENVELALTLSGIKKKERRERAIKVLNEVGLGDKLKSKPNQLSGGQMQRVAIARALVNDPEIILADEPTGALDSKTSVQIMEILKDVSKDRLVVMVTHNPELAEQYSSRIVRLLDGELTEDTKPYSSEEASEEIAKNKEKLAKQEEKEKQENLKTFKKTEKKKSMSFFTALALSFKNILTKKARTILVAFAGSIGIIGIALILAISTGFSTYINKMQEDTLSTYPITIESKSIDFSSIIMDMFMDDSSNDEIDHDKDAVYPKDSITKVLDSVGNSLQSNNLTKFYAYLNENYDDIDEVVNAIKYTYNIDLEFYGENGTNVQPNSNAVMDMVNKYSIYYFQEQTKTGLEKTTDGYKITKTDETDYTFIRRYPEIAFIEQTLEAQDEIVLGYSQVTYLTFVLLDMDMSSMSGEGGQNAMSSFGNMSIFYEMLNNPELIKEQYNLIGENSKFPENANEALLVMDKNNEIDEYVLYALGLLDETEMEQMLQAKVKGNTLKININYDDIIGTTYTVLEESDYYIDIGGSVVDFRTIRPTDKQLEEAKKTNDTAVLAKYQQYLNYFNTAIQNSSNKITITGIVRLKDHTETGSLDTGVAYLDKFTQQMVGHFNDSLAVENGDLQALSLSTPSTINIYVNSFEAKENVKNFINTYNEQAETEDQIKYQDIVGSIMGTVSIIINSITYVLIAFVSVSLIVSSIMIGIITYISVIERTKEIGVLRSIGASKRDIKRVFTSESFIIGLTSGVFGILITLLLIIPINMILISLTGIAGLASLPVVGAAVLILISVILTFIAGLIPARIASKKDPVLALRSE